MADGLEINPRLTIPNDEIELRASRSSGPGGQHANVTASRIEAVFEIATSTALSEIERELLQRRYGPRVAAISQDSRSQARNRDTARRRLAQKIREGLAETRPRHPTRPSRSARERRLKQKRIRSVGKKLRRKPRDPD